MYGGVSKPSTRQPSLLVDVERQRPAGASSCPCRAASSRRARGARARPPRRRSCRGSRRSRSRRRTCSRCIAVDLRGDAPDAPAVPVRAEDGALAVLEERVLLRAQPVLELHVERAHVRAVAPVDVVDDVQKVVDPARPSESAGCPPWRRGRVPRPGGFGGVDDAARLTRSGGGTTRWGHGVVGKAIRAAAGSSR